MKFKPGDEVIDIKNHLNQPNGTVFKVIDVYNNTLNEEFLKIEIMDRKHTTFNGYFTSRFAHLLSSKI